MIRDEELTLIGRFNKPHGINGEISAGLFYDSLDPEALRCIVVKIEAINVPFFISSSRPKGRESFLFSLDGYEDEKSVAMFSNRDFYALSAELKEALDADELEEDSDGLYAADLEGFTLLNPQGAMLGTITGIEDSTANVLFIVERPDESIIYVPVADEFINSIDSESRNIVMNLPQGLLEL